MSNLNAKQTGLILVLVPIVIELTFVAIIARELIDAGKEFQRLHHVKTTLAELHKMQDNCVQTFYVLSDKDKYSYEERQQRLSALVQLFSKPYTWGDLNLNDTPELKTLIEDAEELRTLAINVAGATPVHRGMSGASSKSNRRQNEVLIHMTMEQDRLSKEIVRIEQSMVKHAPEEFKNLQFKFIAIICFGFLLNAGIAFLLIKIFIGSMQSRVDFVTGKGQLLALGQPVGAVLGGKDELSDVDKVITDAGSMLAEIRWTESAVLDNAADVICSLDEKMRFSTVGASSLKVWGHPPDELNRKSIMALVTEETAEATRHVLEKIRGGSSEGKFENVLRTADGSLKDALWTVTCANDKQNYYCVVNDVTEMRNVDRLKKRFMAMASHDYSQPTDCNFDCFTITQLGKTRTPPGWISKRIGKSCRQLSAASDTGQ